MERLLEPIEAAEIDEWFAEFGKGIDPKEEIQRLASKAAQKYRLRGEKVPAHVQAALEATRDVLLEAADVPTLRRVLNKLKQPMKGPTTDVSFAYRNLKGQSQKDRDVLESLRDEVEEDWSKEAKDDGS